VATAAKAKMAVDPARLRALMSTVRGRMLALSREKAIAPARPCEKCHGRSVVNVPTWTYEQRLRAIVMQGRVPQPPPADPCPACYGLGSIDAWRQAQIWQTRCERIQAAAQTLSEYAKGAASEGGTPDKTRCLLLISHALRAHLEEWGEPYVERGREIDLRA
jgi:hypothetical protein